MPGDSDLHFWLTRSVGRSIGLNFTRALKEGRLSPDQYRDLVDVCRTCPHVDSCQRWLGGQSGCGAAPVRAPGFCRNAHALEALRPH
ncbi:DUF6455 family protein [Tropicimonas marinistellae]|uniref:DUF6455 family protein n=1 Tax=Tropicimonas marinistellae TaxID=1739787 RepID=UPI00083196CE|nr:DUF6455 family protein [Tropicimonas marinistellae]